MEHSVTIRGLDELAVTLPYQFGYRLEHCVVALSLRSGRVQSAARIPLELTDLDLLFVAWLRDVPDDLVLIGYGDDVDDVRPLMSALRAAATERGLPEPVGLIACAGLLCPPPWAERGAATPRPLPEPHRVPALTPLIVGGAAPLRSRDQVAALVEPGPGASEARAILAALPPPSAEAGARAWLAVVTDPGEPPRGVGLDLAATAIAAVRDIGFRDVLVQRLVDLDLAAADLEPEAVAALSRELPEPLPPPDAALVDRLLSLAQVTPAGTWAAPVLTVVAVAAWGAGNGTMARCAIDRALRENPTYRLATLVSVALERGLQPPAVSRGAR